MRSWRFENGVEVNVRGCWGLERVHSIFLFSIFLFKLLKINILNKNLQLVEKERQRHIEQNAIEKAKFVEEINMLKNELEVVNGKYNDKVDEYEKMKMQFESERSEMIETMKSLREIIFQKENEKNVIIMQYESLLVQQQGNVATHQQQQNVINTNLHNQQQQQYLLQQQQQQQQQIPVKIPRKATTKAKSKDKNITKLYDEAIQLLEGDASMNAKYYLARAYEAKGNNAKACEYYKQITTDKNFGAYATSKVTALCK